MGIVEETYKQIAELRANLATYERLVYTGFKYDARINYGDRYIIAEAKDNEKENQ